MVTNTPEQRRTFPEWVAKHYGVVIPSPVVIPKPEPVDLLALLLADTPSTTWTLDWRAWDVEQILIQRFGEDWQVLTLRILGYDYCLRFYPEWF